MGLLDASSSSGGSVNTAKAQSFGQTLGTQASANSAIEAEKAHQRQLQLMRETQEYNAREAQKARDFEEKMANTIYTRSVKNMKEAGINPILAANMGLSGASIGSGATASISTPSTFMGQSFADQNSASTSESHGNSWNSSESGLATFLESMGTWVNGMIGALNSSKTIEIALKGMDLATEEGNPASKEMGKDNYQNTYDHDKSLWGKVKQSITKAIKGSYDTTGGFIIR